MDDTKIKERSTCPSLPSFVYYCVVYCQKSMYRIHSYKSSTDFNLFIYFLFQFCIACIVKTEFTQNNIEPLRIQASINYANYSFNFIKRNKYIAMRSANIVHALYPLGPVATLRFCHLRPRCVSKQRRTTNVIISDRVWWIWCDAGLATVATRPQRSPHSVASNSRPDYFAATRSRSLFLTINECCVSAAAAAIWEIQWRRSTPQLAPVDTGGQSEQLDLTAKIMTACHSWCTSAKSW